MAYAECGKNPIILEGDMRCPAMEKILGKRCGIGLADIISGSVEYDSSRIEKLPSGLSVLHCGEIPGGQEELLSSETMRSLVNHLTEEYDLVIVDAPPVTELSDIRALCAFTDGFILSSRVGYSTNEEINQAAEAIKSLGGRVIGVVKNLG